jgi:hypothetical protein
VRLTKQILFLLRPPSRTWRRYRRRNAQLNILGATLNENNAGQRLVRALESFEGITASCVLLAYENLKRGKRKYLRNKLIMTDLNYDCFVVIDGGKGTSWTSLTRGCTSAATQDFYRCHIRYLRSLVSQETIDKKCIQLKLKFGDFSRKPVFKSCNSHK